tara:strand:+ start:253 stop:480 length:228 start_codon:yes stop_codon:yes gene_type:complete
MDLFNTIMETFEEKKQDETKQAEKKQNYIPHIFLIIVLLVCIILGIIYMDKIMEIWRRLISYRELYDKNGQLNTP